MNDTPVTSISEEQSAAIYGGAVSPTQPTDQIAASEPAGEENAPEPVTSDIDNLLAEAEQRGYLRGRNESAAEIMKSPGMYQQPHSPGRAPATSSHDCKS